MRVIWAPKYITRLQSLETASYLRVASSFEILCATSAFSVKLLLSLRTFGVSGPGNTEARQGRGFKAGDSHALEFCGVPCRNRNGASRDSQRSRQEFHKLFVGRAINGRHSNPYSERTIVRAHDLGARGARYHLYLKDNAIADFGVRDHCKGMAAAPSQSKMSR
jgi:hypothetical protein